MSVPGDEAVLLNAVLRVVRDESAYRSWDDMEPALAASWERLRGSTAPHWEDVAGRVRACCVEAGIRVN